MVEGGSSKDFAKVKSLAFNEPEVMHQLLSKLAKSVAAYLSEQVRNGAQALQIFDTWGGSLSHDAYREFSLRYMTEIIEQLPREAEGRRVPVIVFTKGGGQWLEVIADCGADAVGLDWIGPPILARPVPGSVTRSACRGTWILPCLMLHRSASAQRSARSSIHSARVAVTSLIWVTVSPRELIPSMWPRWSMQS